MENDSHTNHAIIPKGKSKGLSLPSEMIRRGLELANRIEQKQVVQPISDKQTGKEYTVRCYLAVMEWIQNDNRYTLKESDKNITNSPVYLVVSVDKDGLHVSCASTKEHLNFIGVRGNDDRYRLLNVFNNLNPFTIPLPSFGLYYTLSHPVEERYFPRRIPQDELKRFSFKLGPTGQPGYKGPATKEANPFFNKDKDCVESVIFYISVLRNSNLKKGFVAKDPHLKLTFVVIDEKGVDDPVASRDLYHSILEVKDPLSTKKLYVDIEEVYRNIPINFTQQEEWIQWEDAHKGKYIKVKGRFVSVSVHPRKGKLFFIVTLNGKEGTIKNEKNQVALLVEGHHKIAMGEKEGSFLFDGVKWICLGEIYAFEGRMSKFSRFDTELRSTGFSNLIIVKSKLMDIREES